MKYAGFSDDEDFDPALRASRTEIYSNFQFRSRKGRGEVDKGTQICAICKAPLSFCWLQLDGSLDLRSEWERVSECPEKT